MKEITFTRNIAEILEDNKVFSNGENTLLILDDVANSLSENSKTFKLFTQKIHHKNVSIIFMLNNFFKQGKAMRDIDLNASYIMLFNNVRDREQINVLSRQIGLSHLI